MDIQDTLTGKFATAMEKVRRVAKEPTETELLKLYGLYKQALHGDIKRSRPGFLLPRERQKWNAHYSEKGLDKSVAQKFYISFVDKLIDKYGDDREIWKKKREMGAKRRKK